jgi:hypothetical protein
MDANFGGPVLSGRHDHDLDRRLEDPPARAYVSGAVNTLASPASLVFALALATAPALTAAQTPVGGGRVHHAQVTLADGRDQTSCAWTDSACATQPIAGDEAELFDPRGDLLTDGRDPLPARGRPPARAPRRR